MSQSARGSKLLSRLGGRMAESAAVGRTEGATAPHLPVGAAPRNDDAALRYEGTQRLKGGIIIPVDRIVADPDQPRKDFDPESIERLAESFKRLKQLQPISVRWNQDMGKWIIVEGERRYRAALSAGLATLQCVEDDGTQTRAKQLVANCLREDLKPVELARALQELMSERGWSCRQAGQELHLSAGQISRAVSLIELPEPIQKQIDAGEIPASAGYELTRIKDPAQQAQLADEVAAGKLDRSGIRERVARRSEDRPTRATYRLDDGWVVTVTHPSSNRPHEQVVDALRRATRQAQGQGRANQDAA